MLSWLSLGSGIWRLFWWKDFLVLIKFSVLKHIIVGILFGWRINFGGSSLPLHIIEPKEKGKSYASLSFRRDSYFHSILYEDLLHQFLVINRSSKLADQNPWRAYSENIKEPSGHKCWMLRIQINFSCCLITHFFHYSRKHQGWRCYHWFLLDMGLACELEQR